MGEVLDAHVRSDACAADVALRELAKRCLAPERSHRPPDAGVVAKELAAYRDSAQERLRLVELERATAEAHARAADAKVRAERRVRRMTLTLAAALLIGTTLTTWQAVAATRAKNTANTKEAETRVVLDFVEEKIFSAARPEGQSGGLGRDVTLQLALEAALPYVDTSFADQPLIEARLRITLGNSFHYLGEAAIAEQQFLRARALYTHHLGPDDPATLASMDGLAKAYAALDRQAEALKLREETLALRKARLGTDHPDTLRSMHELANSYAALNRHDNALKLDEETLALQKIKLGVDHPDTLASMNSLAMSYAANEKHIEARDLHRETLALRQAKLGIDHPDTLVSMHNLAKSYSDLNDDVAALELREKTLTLQKAKLGPNHPDTIKGIYNLANTYGRLKAYEEALQLHQEALELRKAKYGPNHRSTLWSMWGVASELYSLDRGAEAVPITDEIIERAATLIVQPDLVGVAKPRLQYFEKAKNAAGCRTTAELWEKLHRTDARSLYCAACYRAVTAKVIRDTDQSPVAAEQAGAEADRAMAWLQQAVAAGYKKVALLKTDTDLDALRERTDFRKLVSTLGDGN